MTNSSESAPVFPPVTGVTLEAVSDPKPGSIEEQQAKQRMHTAADISAMPWLPQLPDQWATDIYDRIEDYERRLVAPHLQSGDYALGTAGEDDEVEIIMGRREGHLFTAEHATKPWKVNLETGEGAYRFQDSGTAGLAALLAENHGTALIPVGRQTANIPTAENHRFKDHTLAFVKDALSYVSIHGMDDRKFVTPKDSSEVQASIGLGINPTEEMREFARRIATIGREELGLYVIIGNDQRYYVQQPGSTSLKRNQDGSLYSHELAALQPTMLTNVVRRELASWRRTVPALQIELTKLLRLTPLDGAPKDRRSRIIGTALGYKLLERTVELAEREGVAAV